MRQRALARELVAHVRLPAVYHDMPNRRVQAGQTRTRRTVRPVQDGPLGRRRYRPSMIWAKWRWPPQRT